MDNILFNRSKIILLLTEIYNEKELSKESNDFLKRNAASLNSMVDRIILQRVGSSSIVLKYELVSTKALVLEDLGGDLLVSLCEPKIKSTPGFIIRTKENKLDLNILLKSHIANMRCAILRQIKAYKRIKRTSEYHI